MEFKTNQRENQEREEGVTETSKRRRRTRRRRTEEENPIFPQDEAENIPVDTDGPGPIEEESENESWKGVKWYELNKRPGCLFSSYHLTPFQLSFSDSSSMGPGPSVSTGMFSASSCGKIGFSSSVLLLLVPLLLFDVSVTPSSLS